MIHHIYVLGVLFSAFFPIVFVVVGLCCLHCVSCKIIYHRNIILMIFIIMNAFESALGF